MWLYALFVKQPGDYVKKPMQDCSGEKITQEWLYYLGVPVEVITALAATGAVTMLVMMPYVTALFGQFAQSQERDCIFPFEYSVRTPMEAVHTLLNVERGLQEVSIRL